jgi:hypothetical protein
MAFLLLDGFEGYNNPASGMGSIGYSDMWTGSFTTYYSSWIAARGTRGEMLRLHGSSYGSNATNRHPFSTTQLTAGMGLYQARSTDGKVRGFSIWADAGASECAYVTFADGGKWAIDVLEGADYVTYASTTQHKQSVWQYVELQLEMNHAILRIDGITVIDTAINITATDFSHITLKTTESANYTAQVDDMYLSDDLVFHGPMIIQPRTLTQVGGNNFTLGGTDNPTTVAEAVDEFRSDYSSSYASANTPDVTQTFTAAPFDTNIEAILLKLNGLAEDYGQHGISILDGNRSSDAVALWEDQYNIKHIIREDLDDGSPLTAVGADAQEYGFSTKLIS